MQINISSGLNIYTTFVVRYVVGSGCLKCEGPLQWLVSFCSIRLFNLVRRGISVCLVYKHMTYKQTKEVLIIKL